MVIGIHILSKVSLFCNILKAKNMYCIDINHTFCTNLHVETFLKHYDLIPWKSDETEIFPNLKLCITIIWHQNRIKLVKSSQQQNSKLHLTEVLSKKMHFLQFSWQTSFHFKKIKNSKTKRWRTKLPVDSSDDYLQLL